jgi:hypothetical protein
MKSHEDAGTQTQCDCKKKEWRKAVFLKLWSADHKWSSGSAIVVLLDWTLVQKRQKK